MPPPSQVRFRGFEPSDTLRALVASRVGLLETLHPSVTGCGVRIERTRPGTGPSWRVKIRVAVAEDEIVVARELGGGSQQVEPTHVVRLAFDAARRQIDDRVRRSRRSLPPPRLAPPTEPVRPDPGELGDARFTLGALVGDGATAQVYRGRDASSGDTVAVKVLRGHLLENEELVDRFGFEADMLGRLDHPSIPPLLGRGITRHGAPWLATPFAPNGSLADRLRKRTVPPRELISYVMEILDALHYLHQRGIVHRDVKPDNVLIDVDDTALLCDFGIALVPEHRTTIVGDRLGTPTFMSPEQYADPSMVTPQADLFGAGITLFVSLTGQTGMLLLIEDLRPQALASLSDRLAAIVDRATNLRLERRYLTALEMSLDLADLMDNEY